MPEDLIQPVYDVLLTYGPIKCADSKKPLFDEQSWNEAKNFLETIAKGYVSDPPNMSMYYPRYRDADGLVVYRCIRGTNILEGGCT